MIKYWDINSFDMQELPGHRDSVWTLHKMGSDLFSGGRDGMIFHWSNEIQHELLWLWYIMYSIYIFKSIKMFPPSSPIIWCSIHNTLSPLLIIFLTIILERSHSLLQLISINHTRLGFETSLLYSSHIDHFVYKNHLSTAVDYHYNGLFIIATSL